MYDAIIVARYVIDYEASQNRTVSNLRLQKLLYFIQAQFLVSKKAPCFSDKIEAWDFGPVVPNVYHEYKFFGSSSIPASGELRVGNITANDQSIIRNMLEYCKQFSTPKLVTITHNQKPWIDAYNRKFDNTISNQAILSFFGG